MVIKPHRAEPGPWQYKDEETLTRSLLCRFCGLPIQRQGFLRRWAHVDWGQTHA